MDRSSELRKDYAEMQNFQAEVPGIWYVFEKPNRPPFIVYYVNQEEADFLIVFQEHRGWKGTPVTVHRKAPVLSAANSNHS